MNKYKLFTTIFVLLFYSFKFLIFCKNITERKDSITNKTNFLTQDSIKSNTLEVKNDFKAENLINLKEIERLNNPNNNSPLVIKRCAYSNVLLGLYWDKLITIKEIDLKKIDRLKFLEEINSILNSEYNNQIFFSKIYGFSEENSSIFLISKFNECCNLFNLIQEKKMILPIKNLHIYVYDIIKAINFLHKNKLFITYKDFKLENVYISKDGSKVFLDDFGISKHCYTNKSKNKKNYGTIYYMAPELLKGDEFTSRADIYSFGILLYEMFSRKVAYENLSDVDIIKSVVAGQRPHLEFLREDTPKEIVELMIKCWNQVPKKRPTSEDIIYFMKN